MAFQLGAFQDDFQIQDAAPPVIPPVTETPAGRPRRKFYVEIDGQVYWVRSPAEARELFLQARRMAEQAKREMFSDEVALKPLKAPKIKGPPEMRAEIKAVQKEIEAIYRSAKIDYELYYLLHRRMNEEADEEAIFWLM